MMFFSPADAHGLVQLILLIVFEDAKHRFNNNSNFNEK